jgi:hypothetical protein
MTALGDKKDAQQDAQMHAVRTQVRPAFLILLLLVLIGSGAMKLIALHAKQESDPDFQIAVYRYTADTDPECMPWTGRAKMYVPADEGRMLWVRLPQPPVSDIVAGVCPVLAQVAM